MSDKPWDNIDYPSVHDLYEKRLNTHVKLKNAFDSGDASAYAQLGLGISDSSGNYSASEHGLGPQILQSSTADQVLELARSLFKCTSANDITKVIYEVKLPYLRISVGSEMAMMLRPRLCWVTNRRSVWAHLVVKHNGNVSLANDALHAYLDDGDTAKRYGDDDGDYRKWRELHKLVGPSLERLLQLASEASNQSLLPETLKFLWADAIANNLYDQYTSR